MAGRLLSFWSGPFSATVLNLGGVEIQSYWLTQSSGWLGWPHSWLGLRLGTSLEYKSLDKDEVFEMVFRQDLDGKEWTYTDTHPDTCVYLFPYTWGCIVSIWPRGQMSTKSFWGGCYYVDLKESRCVPVFVNLFQLKWTHHVGVSFFNAGELASQDVALTDKTWTTSFDQLFGSLPLLTSATMKVR